MVWRNGGRITVHAHTGSREIGQTVSGAEVSSQTPNPVLYFLQKGFIYQRDSNLPKQHHLLETKCSNEWAYGGTFLIPPSSTSLLFQDHQRLVQKQVLSLIHLIFGLLPSIFINTYLSGYYWTSCSSSGVYYLKKKEKTLRKRKEACLNHRQPPLKLVTG